MSTIWNKFLCLQTVDVLILTKQTLHIPFVFSGLFTFLNLN